MAYQDRWIAGMTVDTGDRECASRYAMIRPVLAQYQRPFTLWDLGANLGYFGCRAAADFGAVSVMVDQRPILADMCRANALPTTVAMTHRLTALDLRELAQSEHADVVLALNVLHHMPDWREALPAVLALGEHVIIETPGLDDVHSANYAESQDLLETLMDHYHATLGHSPSHVTAGAERPLLLFTRTKSALTSSYAYRGRVRPRGPHDVRRHTITSTLAEKSIRYHSGEIRTWYPGMNLWNWLQLGGAYPDRAAVQQQVQHVASRLDSTHGDFKPWNLILQGQTVQAIDGGHRQSVADVDGLAQTLRWITDPELAYAH